MLHTAWSLIPPAATEEPLEVPLSAEPKSFHLSGLGGFLLLQSLSMVSRWEMSVSNSL